MSILISESQEGREAFPVPRQAMPVELYNVGMQTVYIHVHPPEHSLTSCLQ